jgi:4-hydroxybenzoate polyprenyltransferase
MKAPGFLIRSHAIIAFAAVALALASTVQLGLKPAFDASLAIIFFATLFDYNLHSLLKLKSNPGFLNKSDKSAWTAQNLTRIKILIFSALAGLLVSLFFVTVQVLFLLSALALPAILYSIIITNRNNRFRLKAFTGIKILLIASTWSAVTILVPLLESGSIYSIKELAFIFAERFTFIFAIAIPFDIRDMESDRLAGLNTIPVSFGEKRAILFSNLAMLVSMSIACFHYLYQQLAYILPAYTLSVFITLYFINSKRLKRLPLYFHGLLDGSIALHGLLISLSVFLKP